MIDPSTGELIIDNTTLTMLVIFYVLAMIGFWQVFGKAGQSRWLALIPVINVFVYTVGVARLAWWWAPLILVMTLIPFLTLFSVIPLYYIHLKAAQKFGFSHGFALLLTLLTPFGLLILGFGNYQYQANA